MNGAQAYAGLIRACIFLVKSWWTYGAASRVPDQLATGAADRGGVQV